MILFFFVLGSVMGSFFNLVIMRRIGGKLVAEPFSKCDYCNKRLKFYNLIPILSFVFQRGRTTCCKKKLSLIYPVSEIFFGIVFVLVYLLQGGFFKPIVSGTLFSLLIAMSVIDYRTKDLYYVHLLAVFIFSVILAFENYWFKEEILYKLAFTLILLTLGYLLSKKDYVGFGDIVLILSLNLCLNFAQTTIFLLFISLIGGITAIMIYLKKKDRKVKIAFVPIISISFILLEIMKGFII